MPLSGLFPVAILPPFILEEAIRAAKSSICSLLHFVLPVLRRKKLLPAFESAFLNALSGV